MGRKAEPEYLRRLRGKKPRIQADERITFAVAPTRLDPPDYLTKPALVHWERMNDLLAGAGLLLEVIRDKLARYCQCLADYEEVMMARKKRKRLDVADDDDWRLLTHHRRVVDSCEKVFKDFEQEFGLTPAAAARVKRPGSGGPKSPQEKFGDFMAKGKENSKVKALA